MADPVTYPETFRCAQWTPYQIAVDMGLLRTEMDGGGARQRRLYRTMPHKFQLEFVMTAVELGAWQRWVNSYAYDFFTMARLESWHSGTVGEISSPHSVRFIGDLQIENPIYGWVRVKVPAELDPRQAALYGPFTPPNNWLIGGTPATPSADTIGAGTPSTYPLPLISAGTPARPAAII
jgi:hypothetical protein